MSTAGKVMAADIPYDSRRLALFEKLAASLCTIPFKQPGAVVKSEQARTQFKLLNPALNPADIPNKDGSP